MMDWTTKKPTKPGWYWFRKKRAKRPPRMVEVMENMQAIIGDAEDGTEVICIFENLEGPEEMYDDAYMSIYREGREFISGGQWYGPLAPPE